jgi:hypothetical protein
MFTTVDLFQNKEKWEQGRFYTKEELKNIEGPTDPRWMLEERVYYGEKMFVYIFKNTYYPEAECYPDYDSDSDTDDESDEEEIIERGRNAIAKSLPAIERSTSLTISNTLDIGKWYESDPPESKLREFVIPYELEENQKFERAIVPYKSELHMVPLDTPLTGGSRVIKFYRSYIIKGRAHDLLTCKIMCKPQFCVKWAIEVTIKTDYDLDAMLTESDNGITSKFKNNFCRIVSRNSVVEAQISVSSSDMAAATFDLVVDFILDGNYYDTTYNPRVTLFDGSYGYCFNGVFESGRLLSSRSLIAAGQCYFPLRMRRKVWVFLRRYFERIAGWIDSVDDDVALLRLWLEGNYYLVSLIFTEIKKYTVYLSALDGVAVTCLQTYSALVRRHLNFPYYQNPTTLRVDLHEITEMPELSLNSLEDRTWVPVRMMGPIDDYYDRQGVVYKSDQVNCYGDDMIVQTWDPKPEWK